MISHKHRTIFVHIPKCGGISVETVFLDAHNLRWSERAPLLLRERYEAERAPRRLAHLTAVAYVQGHYLSQELFEAYFKFAVVRDPYLRAVSLYQYLGFHHAMSFSAYTSRFLARAVEDDEHPWNWFVKPQAAFICDRKESVLVDKIVRLDRISEELPPVLRRAGAPVVSVPHVNATAKVESPRVQARAKLRQAVVFRNRPRLVSGRHVQHDEATRRAVREIYARDYDLFGY